MLALRDFDYFLPKELIAQSPSKPRDFSRLLILNKKNEEIKHSRFDKIVDFFQSGDVLIINNSKVFPARLQGVKEPNGAKVEVLLHREVKNQQWECLVKGKLKSGAIIKFNQNLKAVFIERQKNGLCLLKFSLNGSHFWETINRIGKMPLPPYIKTKGPQAKHKFNYQTIYAEASQTGSVAAPTAGLHFTKRILKKLKNKGVIILPITLHVGLGTFAPVRVNNISQHKMHQEFFNIKKSVLKEIFKAKQEGRRVVATGTTSCRALESIAQIKKQNKLDQSTDYYGSTDIFIYPGYKFLLTDALVTNFHLPQSSLLMLIAAFTNLTLVKKVYQIAVENKYRFYSYGDAMLIF